MGFAPLQRPRPNQPNILYILADDLGWGDLRCYNSASDIPTPHADRLAAQGMRFTDMHSPSAVCTPTRYGILTGRYCWRTSLKSGVLWGYSPNLIEPGRTTVPALLKAQGYRTAGIGKWHLGLGSQPKADYTRPFHPCPTDHGFDYFYGIPASLDMDPYVYIENDRAVQPPTSSTPGQNDPRGVFWRPGPMAPDFDVRQVLPELTRKAVSYLERRDSSPFFLYLALTAPHTPWLPLEPYRQRSKAGLYGDFVAQVDDTLGRVLRALDETGAAENTLVIFTSDNGAHWTPEDKKKFAHRANAGWRGQKADIHDGGHRIPFLARWPGRIRPGSVSPQIGCLTDLMATVADIASAKLPKDAGEDSYSLAPAFAGKAAARDTVVHHSSEGMFALRQGEWKLIEGLGSGGFTEPKRLPGTGGQLYNLKSDPAETTDLYERHPDIVRRLAGVLEQYRREGRSAPVRD